MNGQPTDIVAFGASTSVGRDAWSSAAAVRAGIRGFRQHPYMIDTGGEPVRAAIAPWLDVEFSGVERFEALLFPAIDEAMAPISEARTGPLRIALLLALPSPRPGLPTDLQPALVKALRDSYPDIVSQVVVFPNGHAAGFLALDVAARELTQAGLDACIVAGVDSYLEPETLEWLEAQDQLHGAGPMQNPWGFVPGEGAGTVLLMRPGIAERLHLNPLARVLSVGTAFEPKRMKSDKVCIGEGLTQAFRSALTALPGDAKISDIYCDMNGEPYRADEYGFASLRTSEAFYGMSDFVAPADCWGDVAAAGAPLHVMLAVVASAKGYARGNVACVWASSEGGERSAALLVTGGGQR
jgi:3-oxoacyl-[acyl-carrier-protein] synthase I